MKIIRPAALTLVTALFAPLLHAAVPTVSLRFSPATAVYGQPVVITATVSGAGATPTGNVILRRGEGSPMLATANLDANGKAELKTTFSSTTTDRSGPNVEVTFSGDANYESAKATQRYTVNPASTRIVLDSSANPANAGRAATISGSVSVVAPAAGAVTTGTVTFDVAGREVGSSSVTNGVIAPAVIELPSGSHTITARFSAGELAAGASFKPSSTTLVQRVVQGSRISAVARVSGRSTTINVTVAPSDGGAIPYGMVRFTEGTTIFGSVQLDSTGNASLTLDDLGHGEHEVTATYIGSDRFGAASATVAFTIGDQTPRVTSVIADEGNDGRTAIELKVTLSAPASEAVSFGYATTDGGAIAGEDYAAATGVVAFAQGQSEQHIRLELLGDRRPEPNEQFVVRFSAGRGTAPPADAQVTIRDDDPAFATARDLVYATVEGEPLTLDLRVPLEGRGPFPIVIVIDAEEWSSPNPRSDAADFLAMRGFAVATVGFRSSLTAAFPAQLVDVRSALQWLRTNARDYNLQPTRIGVWGIGAGGHLAALMGTSDPSLQAIVDWYGQTDLVQLQSDVTSCADYVSASSPAATLLGCPPATCPTTAIAASPLRAISADDPPFLIMHGTFDCLVPPAQSRVLHEALIAAGARSTLMMVDAGRGGAAWQKGDVTEAVAQFFAAQLNAPVRRSRAVNR